MSEIMVLAWGCVLAVVYILAAGQAKTKQYGTHWNMGARDEALPPLNPVAGRLVRAQANFFETFPIFAAAILLAVATHQTDRWTGIGAHLWLGARIIYLPLYGYGVPKVRTFVWMLSMVGIALVLWPSLF